MTLRYGELQNVLILLRKMPHSSLCAKGVILETFAFSSPKRSPHTVPSEQGTLVQNGEIRQTTEITTSRRNCGLCILGIGALKMNSGTICRSRTA